MARLPPCVDQDKGSGGVLDLNQSRHLPGLIFTAATAISVVTAAYLALSDRVRSPFLLYLKLTISLPIQVVIFVYRGEALSESLCYSANQKMCLWVRAKATKITWTDLRGLQALTYLSLYEEGIENKTGGYWPA